MQQYVIDLEMLFSSTNQFIDWISLLSLIGGKGITFAESLSTKFGQPIDASSINKSKSTAGILAKILITYSPYLGSMLHRLLIIKVLCQFTKRKSNESPRMYCRP